jgi:hypothetical protein
MLPKLGALEVAAPPFENGLAVGPTVTSHDVNSTLPFLGSVIDPLAAEEPQHDDDPLSRAAEECGRVVLGRDQQRGYTPPPLDPLSPPATPPCGRGAQPVPWPSPALASDSR